MMIRFALGMVALLAVACGAGGEAAEEDSAAPAKEDDFTIGPTVPFGPEAKGTWVFTDQRGPKGRKVELTISSIEAQAITFQATLTDKDGSNPLAIDGKAETGIGIATFSWVNNLGSLNQDWPGGFMSNTAIARYGDGCMAVIQKGLRGDEFHDAKPDGLYFGYVEGPGTDGSERCKGVFREPGVKK